MRGLQDLHAANKKTSEAGLGAMGDELEKMRSQAAIEAKGKEKLLADIQDRSSELDNRNQTAACTCTKKT